MYDIHNIVIDNILMEELIDEDGVKWYPLQLFLTRILRKSEKAAYFKNTTVAKYMKLIVYTSDRRGMQQPRRTWCINEEGIKFLLKNMKVTKAGSERDYKLRERAFYACCLYFGIKKPSLDFVAIAPNIYNAHSPKEKCSISSLKKTYNYYDNVVTKKVQEKREKMKKNNKKK